MEAKVNWLGRMSFNGVADSGNEVRVGTDPGVGGDDDGVRPLEMLAIGLAGCTAMDVISILNKKRQTVTAFEVQVHAGRAPDHPKVFTDGVIDYLVTGHSVEEDAVRRAIELSVTRYCPASAMFSKVMPIQFKYFIFEGEGEGERTLVTSGLYIPVSTREVSG